MKTIRLKKGSFTCITEDMLVDVGPKDYMMDGGEALFLRPHVFSHDMHQKAYEASSWGPSSEVIFFFPHEWEWVEEVDARLP